MYIDTSTIHRNGKTYTRYLLRENYREKGKIMHRTIANLSKCSPAEINAMKLALKHKHDLTQVTHEEAIIKTTQGNSVGATWLLYKVSKQLGIDKALGYSREGKLALWQVIGRIINPGSRLSNVRLANSHNIVEILGLEAFNEEDLYKNLDWLSEKQKDIEDRLFRQLGEMTPQLFLYDVTSSYLEGNCNELSAYGYNRDKKRGKKQIVIGLLCNDQGVPLSVEVFQGNTSDPTTMFSQIKKAALRFKVKQVTFVGDRGMIKSGQIEELEEKGFHYITAITKKQIETLLNQGLIQMSFFDETLKEIEQEGIRYILRRNPKRASEIQQARESKFKAVQDLINNKNKYLKERPRAKIEKAINKVTEKIKKLKVDAWVEITEQANQIQMMIHNEKVKEDAKLDGCYVIKTDLSATEVNKETVHQCYKNLAFVEQAFRTSKTTFLELRPVHVRLGSRTRGHVFVVMLAYRIIQELKKCWKKLEVTVEEGIATLTTLCTVHTEVKGKINYNQIPEPSDAIKNLLQAANVELPKLLGKSDVIVTTRKKLTKSRKSL